MGEPFRFGLGVRKIYECGRGTPVIAIPKIWRENYGVKTGDSVSIEVLQDGDLLIKAPQP
jgi:bifunctional DNA-binding transcriptional regulator/antitoxin component of YhaV-PrlF toxin-antitoxin module